MLPYEEIVEELHEPLNGFWCVCQGSAFEISSLRGFGSHAGAGEISRAEEGAFAIDDDALHVVPRTEDSLEAIGINQIGKPVEIFSKSGSRLFRVNEPNFDAIENEVVEKPEEGVEPFPPGPGNMDIFDVRRRNPKSARRRRNEILEDGFVDLFV
jgi:hypothetical protein